MYDKKTQIRLSKVYMSKGVKYIKLQDSGMPGWMQLTQEMTLTKFEGDKDVYISIDEYKRVLADLIIEFHGLKTSEVAQQNLNFLNNLKVEMED